MVVSNAGREVTPSPEGLALALSVAEVCRDLKAEDIKIFDVTGLNDLTDFLVIASSVSERHTRAIADAVRGAVRDLGRTRLGREGDRDSGWMIVDVSDVVVHVFSHAMRVYFDLDGLWSDAKCTELPEKKEEPENT